jgi:hypothetical protein
MRIQAIILGAIVFVSACNTKPGTNDSKTDSATVSTDTTGLAAFQAMKAENELGVKNDGSKEEEKSTTKTAKRTSSGTSSSSSSSNDAKGTSTSQGTGTSQGTEKKGWSKTAKGAVIGGVVGAGTGAVVNKKNRAAGAVIGGVIGAGAGAVIGNDMDKKDGRH